MQEDPKDKDQEKGDEVLRRLLKTPPDHKSTDKRPAPNTADEKPASPPVERQGK